MPSTPHIALLGTHWILRSVPAGTCIWITAPLSPDCAIGVARRTHRRAILCLPRTASGNRCDAVSVALVSLPGKSWRGKDAPTPRRVAAWLLAGAALWLATDAGWLHAKAWLAQQLLRDAWQDTLTTQATQHPWPWADTHPVARLTVATLGIDQIVLAGDSGRTLAFGPGWAEASAAPGARGNTVISGHRDTHFAFLRLLTVGDEITLESAHGVASYRVASLRIADTRSESIALDGDEALLLVTCWPFDAVVPGGPLRYVVWAEPMLAAGND